MSKKSARQHQPEEQTEIITPEPQNLVPTHANKRAPEPAPTEIPDVLGVMAAYQRLKELPQEAKDAQIRSLRDRAVAAMDLYRRTAEALGIAVEEETEPKAKATKAPKATKTKAPKATSTEVPEADVKAMEKILTGKYQDSSKLAKLAWGTKERHRASSACKVLVEKGKAIVNPAKLARGETREYKSA